MTRAEYCVSLKNSKTTLEKFEYLKKIQKGFEYFL